ncbi:Uncharacterised protein [Mycobacteroides abscessus subsp. abscessus]|nr:Uncharacterised protein [Mycobacteroides abscessus subsp. abscessus]
MALLLLLVQLLRGVVLLVLRLLSLRGGLARLLLLRLLALLRRLLLRRLVIRVRLAGTLRVRRRGLIVRDLRPVGGLLSLLRGLLATGLAALLGCALCAGLVDGDAVVLVQRRLVTALILGLLCRH